EDERHSKNRFEHIALGATGRRDVCLPRANADAHIKDIRHDFGRKSRAVIGDSYAVVVDNYRNFGWRIAVFARILAVIGQFLQDDLWPLVYDMTCLCDQFLFACKIQQAGGAQRATLKQVFTWQSTGIVSVLRFERRRHLDHLSAVCGERALEYFYF